MLHLYQGQKEDKAIFPEQADIETFLDIGSARYLSSLARENLFSKGGGIDETTGDEQAGEQFDRMVTRKKR